MMLLRVMLVADDPLVRMGLAALLSDCVDCLVVGQAAADADVVASAEVYRPDIVLWDMGWEAPPARLECLPELQDLGLYSVVLVSDASAGVDAWQAGARGLLVRQAGMERLAAALRAVEQGLMVWDESIAIAMPMEPAAMAPPHANVLTSREHEVLTLLAEGLPNKIIADRLQISEHTVKFHVNAIMGKLGAQSRTEAVVCATRRGLIFL